MYSPKRHNRCNVCIILILTLLIRVNSSWGLILIADAATARSRRLLYFSCFTRFDFPRAAINNPGICGSRWRHGGARTQHDPRVDATHAASSTGRVRRTWTAHQHLLAYLHTVSDCFPVAFLPDVLVAYADLSSLRFSPPSASSSFFFFHRVTRDKFSYFSASSSDAHVPLLYQEGQTRLLYEFAFQRVPTSSALEFYQVVENLYQVSETLRFGDWNFINLDAVAGCFLIDQIKLVISQSLMHSMWYR